MVSIALMQLLALARPESHLKQLEKFVVTNQKTGRVTKMLDSKSFQALSSSERFARAVLEVCSFSRESYEGSQANRRLEGLDFLKTRIEVRDLGVNALVRSYRLSGNRKLLVLASRIPLDGGYAEGRELFFTKAILVTEVKERDAHKHILDCINTLKKGGMPEFFDEVQSYLSSQPRSKLVNSLKLAWR